MATEPVPGAMIDTRPAAADRRALTASLVDRVIHQFSLSSSAQSVFGSPVSAHNRTVIPVARVYFAYGGGTGPEVGGRHIDRVAEPDPQPALTSGGGAGGIGFARPAGYIEISEEGSRFVPVAREWRRTAVLAAGALAALLVLRLPAGRRKG